MSESKPLQWPLFRVDVLCVWLAWHGMAVVLGGAWRGGGAGGHDADAEERESEKGGAAPGDGNIAGGDVGVANLHACRSVT